MKCPKCSAENPKYKKYCIECGIALFDIPATLTSPPPPEKKEAPKKSALDFAPGQYFGKRYQIIEEIGRGGMGRVYKALDKELDRVVALKMTKPELSSKPGIVERFKKEISLASQISHENVCRIHDLGEVKGIKFISMQYIEGNNLHELIQTSKGLKIDTAINIAEQICQALTAAHKKGVIHRDLKPQNIMIDKQGNAYVMDFGIARSLEIEEVTRPGAVIGTPHYMAPEQSEGKEASRSSDIYSLGCILYEMLTGKPPFDANTTAALIHKQITEIPKPPSKLNPQIPKTLENITLKCLEKNPEKRYQSVDEILKAIDTIKPEFVSATKKSKFNWKLLIPIATIILISIAIGFYYFIIKEKPPTTTIQTEWKNSIAILPFRDLSPKNDQEYFCDGMTETIIGKLSRLKELKVISRTSVMQYKDKAKNIKKIGKELSVAKILEGSIQKEKENIRVTAQLINVEDGFPLWSKTYNRKLASVFAIQDEISEAIANKIIVEFGADEKPLLVKRHTENLEAYSLYLKGQFLIKVQTEERLKKGIEYFQQAIEIDPTYALAYVGIADCYLDLSEYGFLPSEEGYPKARAAAERALEIDDTLAEAHKSLAWIKEAYGWDWEGAEREYKRAIELNSSYASAHYFYAWFLVNMGRYEESITEAERAVKLDPLSRRISRGLGRILFFSRQYDQAIAQFIKVIEKHPSYSQTHRQLAEAYALKGMYKEAIEEIKIAKKLGDTPVFNLTVHGYIYGISGKEDEAKNVLNELLELSKNKYVPSFFIAKIYAGLGQKDKAFKWLEKAYQEHEDSMTGIKVSPILDSLRSDPRFKALLKKMNLE